MASPSGGHRTEGGGQGVWRRDRDAWSSHWSPGRPTGQASGPRGSEQPSLRGRGHRTVPAGVGPVTRPESPINNSHSGEASGQNRVDAAGRAGRRARVPVRMGGLASGPHSTLRHMFSERVTLPRRLAHLLFTAARRVATVSWAASGAGRAVPTLPRASRCDAGGFMHQIAGSLRPSDARGPGLWGVATGPTQLPRTPCPMTRPALPASSCRLPLV